MLPRSHGITSSGGTGTKEITNPFALNERVNISWLENYSQGFLPPLPSKLFRLSYTTETVPLTLELDNQIHGCWKFTH